MDRPGAEPEHLHGRSLGQKARRDLQIGLGARPQDHLLPAHAKRHPCRDEHREHPPAQRRFLPPAWPHPPPRPCPRPPPRGAPARPPTSRFAPSTPPHAKPANEPPGLPPIRCPTHCREATKPCRATPGRFSFSSTAFIIQPLENLC